MYNICILIRHKKINISTNEKNAWLTLYVSLKERISLDMRCFLSLSIPKPSKFSCAETTTTNL